MWLRCLPGCHSVFMSHGFTVFWRNSCRCLFLCVARIHQASSAPFSPEWACPVCCWWGVWQLQGCMLVLFSVWWEATQQAGNITITPGLSMSSGNLQSVSTKFRLIYIWNWTGPIGSSVCICFNDVWTFKSLWTQQVATLYTWLESRFPPQRLRKGRFCFLPPFIGVEAQKMKLCQLACVSSSIEIFLFLSEAFKSYFLEGVTELRYTFCTLPLTSKSMSCIFLKKKKLHTLKLKGWI